MAALLIIFTMIFVFGPIAKAYADRIAREGAPQDRVGAGEVSRLREEVERLSLEVSRLQEEQSFMVRLLSDGERKKLVEGRQSDG